MTRTSPALLLSALLLGFSVPTSAAEGTAAQGSQPGIQLFDAGKAAEAAKFLEPWAKAHPKDAEAAYYLGRSFWLLRDYDQAVEWLETATQLAPRNAEYQLWLGRSYGRSAQNAGAFKAMGFAKRCHESYEKAVALDPNLIDARDDLMQFYLQAPGIVGGSVEDAKVQAAEIGKRDASRGAMAQASIAVHEKDPASAIKVLTAAIAKAPADPKLQMSLGNVYTSQERWDDAFRTYEGIVAADPNHWNALYQIGRTAAVSGKRLDQGKSALERYLAGTPGSDAPPMANAHYRLGMIYQLQGNKAAARAEYQTALKLDPKLKDAKEALDKLG